MSDALRAATRSSPLAQWQTDHVAALAATACGAVVEPLLVDTLGDRTQALGTPLHEIGGRGVFVKEVQAAVLHGHADLAVHSAKDLPSTTVDGLVLAGIPTRGDVRDVLIGATLDLLPIGARVGTSSVRRGAQLRAVRPDVEIVPIRGNVGTRLARIGELDAIIGALVPYERLQMMDDIAHRFAFEVFETETMLPMVAQGALAIECRPSNTRAYDVCVLLTDERTRIEVSAERAYLARLGGGCDLPVAALARYDEAIGLVHIDALVSSYDGTRIVRRTASGADPLALGDAVAEEVLGAGGDALLAERIRDQ